jgi:peptide/nickel transport system substrate-binding protein
MDKKRRSLESLAALILIVFALAGCKPEPKDNGNLPQSTDSVPVMGDWIRIYHAADPDGLHPYNGRNAYATHVKEHIYMYLMDYHPHTLEHVPTLAKAAPVISLDGLNFTFEIRPEAKWDNGDPITARDYEFSIKCCKLPLTDNAQQRTYFSFIKDVKVDSSNDRRVTIYTDAPFFLAETAVSGIEVISKNFYDPNNLLGKYTVLDIYSKEEEVAKDPDMVKFAEDFNSQANSTDPARIYGSGPYKVESWTPGDNVTLVRKKDWWGDKLRGQSWYFQGYASKLIFKTIRDRSTLPAAIKNDELDIIRDMSPDDFKAAQEDTAGLIYKNYNFHTPNSFSSVYLGFNTRPSAGRKPVVEDVAVRRAIAMCTNIDSIIQNVYRGYGRRQTGPITPLHDDEYHPELKALPFDPEAAKKVLEEAGWVDTDGNGIREKIIRGKKVELKIEVLISNTSETGPRMVRMVADQAQRVGMQLITQPMDFGTLGSRIREHDFDMFGLGFAASPLPTDLKQVWHTENWANNGSNYFGFGNEATDSLIEQIRVTIDPEARRALYWRFQELWYEQLPMIMVMAPRERILIHKRFRNAEASEIRPGTKPIEFWAPVAEQKFK